MGIVSRFGGGMLRSAGVSRVVEGVRVVGVGRSFVGSNLLMRSSRGLGMPFWDEWRFFIVVV